MERQAALDRMVQLYEGGLLTPFLGAGMSRPHCPDWFGFVDALVREAHGEQVQALTGKESTTVLVQRADRAVMTLKLQGRERFQEAVRRALAVGIDAAQPPPQAAALGLTWWPLVLTTNYDDWFLWSSFRGRAERARATHPSMLVMGRAANDCEQVLASLRAPSRPILWALQGFLGGQHPVAAEPVRPDLADELVIGHEEYRRVTFTAPHFRQAFTEVFRSRSLLFLGCGLADAYLLDLFGQCLELSGPNPLPHFALVPEGTVDVAFLERRLGICTVEYDPAGHHAAVPALLEELDARIRGSRPRVSRWSFDFGTDPGRRDAERAQFNIVRSRLPVPGEGACVAVSAGIGERGSLWVSSSIDTLLRKTVGTTWRSRTPRLAATTGRVVRIPGQPVYLCAAREAGDRRHLRTIGAATRELLEEVQAGGEYQHVHMQLLAVGRGRVFPAFLSLTEITRAAGRWFRRHPESPLRLSLHVIAPDVLHDLNARRLVLTELLYCDDLRLWLEVQPRYGRWDRQLVHLPSDTPLTELAEHTLGTVEAWELEVLPTPRAAPLRVDAAELNDHGTIGELGVAPGMTLRFAQLD